MMIDLTSSPEPENESEDRYGSPEPVIHIAGLSSSPPSVFNRKSNSPAIEQNKRKSSSPDSLDIIDMCMKGASRPKIESRGATNHVFSNSRAVSISSYGVGSSNSSSSNRAGNRADYGDYDGGSSSRYGVGFSIV